MEEEVRRHRRYPKALRTGGPAVCGRGGPAHCPSFKKPGIGEHFRCSRRCPSKHLLPFQDTIFLEWGQPG